VELTLSFGWLILVIWLILKAYGQRSALPALVARTAPPNAHHVAVIVPARDEAANITSCLQSLLAQTYPRDRLRLIAVDDDSSDDTAALVEGLAARDPRLALLRTPPLPYGWKGKVHACWTGANAANAGDKWLCFIDADMRADPHLIASAIAAADDAALDLLSLAPRHELVSFAERLMIPCGLYLLAFSQDLNRVQASDTDSVVAMGQFMLIRHDAYRAVGGHAAIRGAISEDVALAHLLKRRGRAVMLDDGSRLLHGRMYTGWATLWPGITKNLTDMLGGPLATVAMALVALTVAWAALLLPGMDVAACNDGSANGCIALAAALVGSAMAFGLHIAGAIHFGIPFWYGLLFPLGYSVGAVMAFDSLRQRLVGRVHWKGRVYP
jgi:chlorobactene glucosyltransferase